jgi:D-tyrosyl-tRNA(Tyr) deacylase
MGRRSKLDRRYGSLLLGLVLLGLVLLGLVLLGLVLLGLLLPGLVLLGLLLLGLVGVERETPAGWRMNMKAVLQRVAKADVKVEGEVVGRTGPGLLVLVAVCDGDELSDVEWIARKIVTLRVFPDDEGKMNRSVVDIGGSALLVSQFTLSAHVGKGTRPSFGKAMEPDRARAMFDDVVDRVRGEVPTETGKFRAHMEVSLVNDGPVTLWLDSRKKS